MLAWIAAHPWATFAVLALLSPVLYALAHMVFVLAANGRDLVSIDRWTEVFITMGRNKLRTMLTMLSVGWGIFVLVFLLGLGNGLQNAMRFNFSRESANAAFIRIGKTSVPFGGYDVGRRIEFTNADYTYLRAQDGISHPSAEHFIESASTWLTKRGTKANPFQIEATYPNRYYLEPHTMVAGRFMNEVDIAQKRKSAVVGKTAIDFLFEPDEDPIGQWIEVAGVPYQVIGVFTHQNGTDSERRIYIPASTAQLAYNGEDKLGKLEMELTTTDVAETERILGGIVAELAARHDFDPTDKQAARVRNNVEGAQRFGQIFWMIAVFIGVIGLGTLAAGVVGVSNIMMIAVKERTKEIGVRKALGATPGSIVAMIVQESVFLTSIAGLLGLAGGVGALALLSKVVAADSIRNPSIELSTGVSATVFLIVCGALAGYFPARAAARVNPIHSLRDQ